MLKEETKKDILNVSLLIKDYKKALPQYDYIYTRTNENLNLLLKDIEVKNKKVLTVLASSDQLFYFLLKNAKEVETFDINVLTKYFFYLRKWNLLYLKEYFYPKGPLNSNYILKLLEFAKKNITTDGEEQAYLFWKSLTNRYNTIPIAHHINKTQNGIIKEEKNELIEKLKTYELKFKNINIMKKQNRNRKKHDIIFISNIPEWYDDIEESISLKENVINLLEDDGRVIGSNILETEIPEKDLFKKEFDYIEDIPYKLGYTLQKIARK